MEYEEIMSAYQSAYDQGFVTDLKTCECNQECDDCPAADACNQLSEGDYKMFVKNYALLKFGED